MRGTCDEAGASFCSVIRDGRGGCVAGRIHHRSPGFGDVHCLAKKPIREEKEESQRLDLRALHGSCMREREGVYPIGSSRPEPSPPPTPAHTHSAHRLQSRRRRGPGGGVGVGLGFEPRHRASSRCAGTETGHSDGLTRPQRRPASAVVPLPSPAPDRQSREQKKTRGWERSASCSGHPAARRNGPEAGLPQLRGRGRARRQSACWVPGPAPDCPGPPPPPPGRGGGDPLLSPPG